MGGFFCCCCCCFFQNHLNRKLSLEYWLDEIYYVNNKKEYVLRAQKVLLSHTPLTLTQGHLHHILKLNVESSSFYHDTKTEPNHFIKLQMHANIKGSLMKSVKPQLFPQFNKSFLKLLIRMFNLNCFNITSNFIPITWKVCQKIKLTNIAFLWPCDPQPVSRYLKVV